MDVPNGRVRYSDLDQLTSRSHLVGIGDLRSSSLQGERHLVSDRAAIGVLLADYGGAP